MAFLPSDEQRAATVAKFPPNYRIVDKWGEGSPSPCPTEPVHAEVVQPDKPKRSWQETLSLKVTLVGIACLVIGIFDRHRLFTWTILPADPSEGNYVASIWYFGFPIIGAVILVGYWCLAFLYLWLRLSAQIGRDAARPCPSPAEIETELRARGYDPSIADVMAVHAAAKREQYENLALVAGWFALNVDIGRRARGNPPL